MIALLSAASCAAARRGPAPFSEPGRLARLERLESSVPSPDCREIRVGLAARREVGAWSWPDGRIKLSRALVDMLDDQELAAVIAHELGHLYDGGHLSGAPAALRGDAAAIDPETRADRIGCAVLAQAGLSPESMVRMLTKVAASTKDGESLRERAAAAMASCRSPAKPPR